MNSRNLALQHAVRVRKNAAPLAAATIPQQARARIAATDDAAAADAERAQNVLWVMAIALGVFCGFAAVVIALG
jgi:hypothetical protein